MNQQQIIQIGFFLIFLGIMVIFFGSHLFSEKADAKFSFVGFLGFIPFGFSNDKKLLVISLVIMFILIVFILTSFQIKRFI
jgi:uncharacterized membrane protein